jgi:hypothetical protein
MAGFVYPQVEQLHLISLLKTQMATGILKLFKSAIAFGPGIAQADLAAIECDFTGYAAITLTTLPAAFVDPINQGVSFQIPTVQWTCSNPLTVANAVYGGWIEDSTNVLLMAWQINVPWQMGQPSQALPLDLLINMYGTNQVYVNIQGQPQ